MAHLPPLTDDIGLPPGMIIDLEPGEAAPFLTPEEGERVARLMLCAIARSPDGSVSLTVYEDGRASTLETDAAGAQLLADLLTGRGR